jgi:hypothetical protein
VLNTINHKINIAYNYAFLLNPITTWLFSWKYFQSVTLLINKQNHIALRYFLTFLYWAGNLVILT